MKDNKRKRQILISDITVAIPSMLFLLSLAVLTTLYFRPLYYFDIDYLDLEGKTGYTKEEIKANYDAIIDYNMIGSGEKLILPTMPLTENAGIHFQEVKDIFIKIRYLCMAAFVISIISIFFKARRGQWYFLKVTAILNIGIPPIFGLLIWMNWKRFFVVFHQVFFRNDYWLFDPVEDPVIKILPDEFFLHSALLMLFLIAISSVLCTVGYFLMKKKEDMKNQ